MELKARVLKVSDADNGTQVLTVKLDHQKTKAQCTVREGENFNAAASCAGCSGCSHGNGTGLFAVNGDTVNAINRTGTRISEGSIVELYIPKKRQVLDFIVSIAVPTILAIAASIILGKIFRNELAYICGVFLGLTLGVVISFFVNKYRGTKNLPEVVECRSL